MKQFFGNFYDLFQPLFGADLSYYLWGYNPATQWYSNPNLFNLIGSITLAIALVFVLVYYYIKREKFCKWWSWLITLVVNGVAALTVAYGIVAYKYAHGFVPWELMCKFDADGHVLSYTMGYRHIWNFSVTNMIVGTAFFLLFSIILRWWSPNRSIRRKR